MDGSIFVVVLLFSVRDSIVGSFEAGQKRKQGALEHVCVCVHVCMHEPEGRKEEREGG